MIESKDLIPTHGCYGDDCTGVACVFDDPDFCVSDCDLASELSEAGLGREDCEYWLPLVAHTTLEMPIFDDDNIFEQSIGDVRRKNGEMTTGISLLISSNFLGTEIILEYEQLKAAVALLEELHG